MLISDDRRPTPKDDRRTAVIDRLTAQDLSNLWPENLGWPQDIGAIAVLDGAALLDVDGSLRLDDIRTAIAGRLHRVPRLRQVMHRPRAGLGGPLWVDAADFDLADHVRVRPLVGAAGEDDLLRGCAQLRNTPLDRSRPLWQLWLLPGLADGRVGMFLRLHHVIADGVAGVALIGGLLDGTGGAVAGKTPSWTPRPAPSTRALLADNVRRSRAAVTAAAARITRPVGTVRAIRGAWPAMHEVLMGERAPRTSLNRPFTGERRLALVRARLDAAKRCARAHEATVNDVVLAVVAGGLRDLLVHRGEPVDGVNLLAAIPVSLHHRVPGEAKGNLDGGMVVPLPVGEPDPAVRLRLIAADTARRKLIPRTPLFGGILGVAAVQRAVARTMTRQRRANIYVANVPGPPGRLYLAGAALGEVFPVVPLMGNIGLGVGVLSYAGQLNFTVVADRAGFPDLRVFLAGMQRSLVLLDVSPSVPVQAG
jgi:WS/DGAT/MGAT family acyltransferase